MFIELNEDGSDNVFHEELKEFLRKLFMAQKEEVEKTLNKRKMMNPTKKYGSVIHKYQSKDMTCKVINLGMTPEYVLSLQNLTISRISKSSGFGSFSRELIDRRAFKIVKARLHWYFTMSKQILSFEFILFNRF